MENKDYYNNYTIGLGDFVYSEKPDEFNFVELKIEDKDIKINLKEELEFNTKNIVDTMAAHSGKFGWWSSLNCLVKRKLRGKKFDLSKKSSALDSEARNSLKLNDMKVTEAGVASWISNDPRVSILNSEIKELEDVQEFIESVLRSFEHRRDMIKEVNKAMLIDQSYERN